MILDRKLIPPYVRNCRGEIESKFGRIMGESLSLNKSGKCVEEHA